MSYEDDERLVQKTIKKNRSLQNQIKHAVRNKYYENVKDIVTHVLLMAGRQLTHVNELAQMVYQWFNDFTNF